MLRFSLFVAFHHLLAQKRMHATNAIAWIAMAGVAISAMALVVVLSVFNGIESLVGGMYSSWDTDLKIMPAEGKVMRLDSMVHAALTKLPDGSQCGMLLEEDALFEFVDRQHLGHMLGIDTVYASIVQLPLHSVEGYANLYRGSQPLAVLTRGVAYYLGASVAQFEPISVHVPNRTARNWLNPETALRKKRYAFDAIIGVNADFDTKNVVLPIREVQRLLDHDSTVVSAIMIAISDKSLVGQAQQQLQEALGQGYTVQNRLAQNATLYRTMRSERLIILIILSLILLIATFNVVGSLSMLIIEKQEAILTLFYLGSQRKQIRQIFLLEGVLIALLGGGMGILLGLLLCWLQQRFGLIGLHGSGSFVVDAYPVEVHVDDVFFIVGIVTFTGLLASLVPLGSMRFDQQVGIDE